MANYHTRRNVVFESFQVAAPAAKVLEAAHALTWDFPDRAVSVPLDVFSSDSFMQHLASFLEQSTKESFDRFAARAFIGGKAVVETRDCPSPALITEMLLSLLEGLGDSGDQFQRRVQKKIRDEVILGNSEIPWRRSPYWLVLRVLMQRQLALSMAQEDVTAGVDRVYYKFLMAAVLARLIHVGAGAFHPEKTMTLIAKLSRRLAKLESDRQQATGPLRSVYDDFFSRTSAVFIQATTTAKGKVTNAWAGFKQRIKRQIPRLPRYSSEADRRLLLTNSGRTLHTLLSQPTNFVYREKTLNLPTIPEGTVFQIAELASQYTSLHDLEIQLISTCRSLTSSPEQQMSPEDRCQLLGHGIIKYLDRAPSVYEEDSLLMSRCLLNVFEQWVVMDQAAVEACPLLGDYHPIFVPSALDVLCLQSYAEMERLQKAQEYLANRIAHSRPALGTIFSDLTSINSFPVQFLKTTDEGRKMVSLGKQIDALSEASRTSKMTELRGLMDQYHQLTEDIEKEICSCTYKIDGTKDITGCIRCFKWRSRNRLKIIIHEDFLPDATIRVAQRSAILFELCLPDFFAQYREATWKMMLLGSDRASASHSEDAVPRLKLEGAEQLTPFQNKPAASSVLTMASIKKSILHTHYRTRELPVEEAEICVSFNPLFNYHDETNSLWTKDMLERAPGFEHLLGSWLPYGDLIADPYAKVETLIRDDGVYPPSSYEIAANEPQCPPHLSAQEFSAFQRAVSGRGRRWIVLLIELGATNVNFTSETTMKLFNHLAIQAGPANRHQGVLREAHVVFSDPKFSLRLYEQLRKHLASISTSWRELHYMSIIIRFSMRLYHLCPTTSKWMARNLLSHARDTLTAWINRLRIDVRTTKDPDVAQKAARYAFHASLLCRQIFFCVLAGDEGVADLDLRCFIRASIALQENLVVDIHKLTPVQKLLLGQNLYESYNLREAIKQSVIDGGMEGLQDAINETWTDAGILHGRSYSTWTFLKDQDGFWMASRASNGPIASSRSQVVHFHLLQGHLLIDGQPLGRLPLTMREDAAIKELFGDQHLLTRPSGLPGMKYHLVSPINYHQIHFGGTAGSQGVVIKAIHNNQVLEHVNRNVFKSPDGKSMDLPLPLIDDCVHWLNIKTGMLEMRRKPDIWKFKGSYWVLDINARKATRNGKSQVVEPQSNVGRQIASIFRGFEDPSRLTIFQPLTRSGILRVEMKRLELQFFVNNHRLLQSDQLKCEIDPEQDIGTWHGLVSGIVVRSTRNLESRSILVPLGPLQWKRAGMHISVFIDNSGEYSRYSIDRVLGKLDCAPEPTLLYWKAALHALTSFPLPDGLTNRTGTEEAIQCLSSAASRPWDVLGSLPQGILMTLQTTLASRRAYYPADKKMYQKVDWDRNLTTTMQHESIGFLAERILLQSRRLALFQPPEGANGGGRLMMSSADGLSSELELHHLKLRSLVRRYLYERPCFAVDSMIPKDALDPVYFDTKNIANPSSKESSRVYSLIKSLHDLDHCHSSLSLRTLQKLLERKSLIGGFTKGINSSAFNIPDLLDIDLPLFWGTLVQTCRQGSPLEQINVCFALAMVAYGKNHDPELVKWLATIATTPRLRTVTPPKLEHQEPFKEYKGAEMPNRDVLESLLLHGQVAAATHLAGRRDRGRRGRGDNSHGPAQFRTAEQQLEASRLASRVLTWYSTRSEISEEDLKDMAEEAGCGHLDISLAWSTLQPELRRVSDNEALHIYIAQLDKLVQQEKDQGVKELARLDLKPKTHSKLEPDTKNDKETTTYILPDLRTLSVKKSLERESVTIEPCPAAKVSGKEKDTASSTALVTSSGPLRFNNATISTETKLSKEILILRKIIEEFATSSDATRQQYGKDLKQSLAALTREEIGSETTVARLRSQSLITHGRVAREIQVVEEALQKQATRLHDSFSDGQCDAYWLQIGNLWPSMSHISLLELLRSDHAQHLEQSMKEELVSYGLLIASMQRLLRIQDALLCERNEKVLEEQNHQGHTNWDPVDHPEWLLLEIDNNILIRASQIDVARAIISPSSDSNSVLQMNMGQGKTSCIMPMAVTALADKNQLCRIIVPRALLQQTAQVIQSRLGGLVGRVVQHIPFSRRTPSSQAILDQFQDIHTKSLEAGGVMLCLPEHILSFKLSGLQRLSDGQLPMAQLMMGMQDWLDSSSRDILDESDFTLSAKTQLIYPSGPQTAVDGHPHRWRVTEDLLSLVEKHVTYLESKFPDGIHVVRRHQGYPILYFLHSEVEDCLGALLIGDVCSGRLSLLELKATSTPEAKESQQRDLRAVLLSTGSEPSAATWNKAAEHLADDVFGFKSLLLLRGLISQHILLLCLKKRWNVQYGIHPSRPPIAVPFEAKGIPSQTAEYGHPDTAIILTCLAFYQTGLSIAQMEQSLKHILKLADPAVGYESWIQGCQTLPSALQHWNLVNADDVQQVGELWHHLHLDRNVINQYMNTFVFPAHAKQFSLKLQASGWDIPLFVPKDEKKKIVRRVKKNKPKGDTSSSAIASSEKLSPGQAQPNTLSAMEETDSRPPRRSLTTGFSGTNDNKRMLPDTIRQDDLPSLLQTNAQVLKYLLEPRNRQCLRATDNNGRALSEIGLLHLLKSKHIRILIDSGAYILEMENEAVAAEWLTVDAEARGVVYFGKRNQIMVRARFLKNPMPLLASPFADSLEDCCVYIDEAHTRGTDLKLPPSARGALTLGLGQTKDHTVQGAMRLRQLGSSQSIAFVAPLEVYRSILDLQCQAGSSKERHSNSDQLIDSADVVRWLLEQSCKLNDQMMSLHIAQGVDFCRRTEAKWRHTKALTDRSDKAQLLSIIRQEEDQTLAQLYGSRTTVPGADSNGKDKDKNKELSRPKSKPKATSTKLNAVMVKIEEKRMVLPNNKVGEGSAFQEVEQEREVEFEVEQVRQKKKPEKLVALSFPGLDTNIVHFVETGTLYLKNQGFLQAFAYLSTTVVGQKYEIQDSGSKLFVSRQFSKTVVYGGGSSTLKESIIRPVEWILWSVSTGTALIVIPEEAELLLPMLRDRPEKPKVWLLSYAAPVTRAMCQFSRLDYYPVPFAKRSTLKIPDWLSTEVGIVSGRVYFDWHEHEPLLKWLEMENSDGDANSKSKCGLSTAETKKFLLDWLTHCRQLHNVLHTPMGFICQGRELQSDHSFFTSPTLADGTELAGATLQVDGESHGHHRSDYTNGGGSDEDDSENDDEWMHQDAAGEAGQNGGSSDEEAEYFSMGEGDFDDENEDLDG